MSDDTHVVDMETDCGAIVRSQWSRFKHPSTAIIETVAAATDRDETNLPPLQHYVDADSLDTLLTATTGNGIRISFAYDGVDVTVDGNGELAVRPARPGGE